MFIEVTNLKWIPLGGGLAVVWLGSQGRGSAFKVCHALLKSAILLHKIAIVYSLMSIAEEVQQI